MNYSGNFKLTKLRNLFKIFKYSLVQSLSIFGAREGIQFELQNLSSFCIFEKKVVHKICARPSATVGWFWTTTVPGAHLDSTASVPTAAPHLLPPNHGHYRFATTCGFRPRHPTCTSMVSAQPYPL
jgi:hypothetical protein